MAIEPKPGLLNAISIKEASKLLLLSFVVVVTFLEKVLPAWHNHDNSQQASKQYYV